MQLKTILNRVQKFKSFVYKSVRWVGNEAAPELEVEVAERANGKPVCSGCGHHRPGYDRLAKRRFEFVPLWGIKVFLKCVFGLVIDFGTSQSPKSTRPLTTYWCPSRLGHQALRNNFASSLLLRTCLPMTGRRVWMPTLLPLWRYAHDG